MTTYLDTAVNYTAHNADVVTYALIGIMTVVLCITYTFYRKVALLSREIELARDQLKVAEGNAYTSLPQLTPSEYKTVGNRVVTLVSTADGEPAGVLSTTHSTVVALPVNPGKEDDYVEEALMRDSKLISPPVQNGVHKSLAIFRNVHGDYVGLGVRVGDVIVTAAHVLKHANEVTGSRKHFPSGYQVTALGRNLDIASVTPTRKGFFATAGLSSARVGRASVHLGISSVGYQVDQELAQSSGVISGVSTNGLIQHTCSTLPGFSGGPLYHGGAVIGIHVGAHGDHNVAVPLAPLLRSGLVHGKDPVRVEVQAETSMASDGYSVVASIDGDAAEWIVDTDKKSHRARVRGTKHTPFVVEPLDLDFLDRVVSDNWADYLSDDDMYDYDPETEDIYLPPQGGGEPSTPRPSPDFPRPLPVPQLRAASQKGMGSISRESTAVEQGLSEEASKPPRPSTDASGQSRARRRKRLASKGTQSQLLQAQRSVMQPSTN